MSNLFSHIVVAVDESEPSEGAVALALDLAKQNKGEVTFVHAIDWVDPVSRMEASSVDVADPEVLVEALRTEGRALSERVQARAQAAGIPCKVELIEDKPVAAILSGAKEAGAGIIIIGTHGRRGVARFVLGSVAEGVVRESAIPVLMVPGSRS
jgi:nucleotide-binding universal stress UspA family protein